MNYTLAKCQNKSTRACYSISRVLSRVRWVLNPLMLHLDTKSLCGLSCITDWSQLQTSKWVHTTCCSIYRTNVVHLIIMIMRVHLWQLDDLHTAFVLPKKIIYPRAFPGIYHSTACCHQHYRVVCTFLDTVGWRKQIGLNWIFPVARGPGSLIDVLFLYKIS